MNRQKLLKITTICAGIVIVLLVALSILIRVVISPEQVKKTILPRISAAMNRQVSLGDVSVSIFSGIRLHDLVIQDREGTQPFVKAGALRLEYRFWPLLRKRVEITEIRLESPLLRVVRYTDGSFNFSDLTAKKEQPTPTVKSPIDLAVSQFTLTNGTMIFDDRQGLGGKPYVTEINNLQMAAKNISMNGDFPVSLQANLPGGATIDIAGTAARVGSAPSIVLTTTLIAKDLAKLVAGLPTAVTEKTRTLALAGGLELRLKVAGETKTPKQLLQSGEIKLNSIQLTAGGTRPSLSGLLILGKDSIESKELKATIAGQQLGIGLKGTNLLGKPAVLSLAIQGDKLDLNQLLPPSTAKSAAPAIPASAAKAEPDPMNLPLTASGTVRVNSVLYRTLTFNNLSMAWKLADNVFTLDSLKGNLAGGSFSESARVNLGVKGYGYSSQLSAQGVQADQLVSALAPKATGSVFGSLGFTAQFQGSGTLPESIKRNLSGQGNFAISDGKLTGSGFMQGLAGFLKADQLRVLRFSRYNGTFGIKGAVVSVNSELNGSDARIKSSGTVDFEKRLNMSLDTRMSPAITSQAARGELGRFLTDSQGWGVIPLKVSGTIASPTFSLDAALAGAHLKDKLREELGNRIFKGKQGQQGTQKPEQQLLDRGLERIFGK
ncbi:MAG: AsmA family protein [Desulfuromonadales bacterium]|nr:AsmA family protein [Desulfuromonadales bacterium]